MDRTMTITPIGVVRPSLWILRARSSRIATSKIGWPTAANLKANGPDVCGADDQLLRALGGLFGGTVGASAAQREQPTQSLAAPFAMAWWPVGSKLSGQPTPHRRQQLSPPSLQGLPPACLPMSGDALAELRVRLATEQRKNEAQHDRDAGIPAARIQLVRLHTDRVPTVAAEESANQDHQLSTATDQTQDLTLVGPVANDLEAFLRPCRLFAQRTARGAELIDRGQAASLRQGLDGDRKSAYAYDHL